MSGGGTELSVIKTNGEFRSQSALQGLAAQLERLVYRDMIKMARDIHAAGDSVGKTPVDIADALHDWAVRELEGCK